MTDNIKPEHYRKGEIDLFESWYRTYPFNEYRAIMQAVAERYMRRDKNNRVEDLDKAVETLKRLKEKEIEHAEKNEEIQTKDGTVLANSDDNINYHENIYLLKYLLECGFEYLARDKVLLLWAYDSRPKKSDTYWGMGDSCEIIKDDNFPEVQWTDNEPTKISELLASYENGGENGK